MKSPDLETLDPEVARQLGAIDRALAGEPVDPDLADLATLTADLRAERAAPPEQWSQEMDLKAGAGFGSSRLRSLRRLLPEQPRRMLLPVGALATLLVAIGVGVGTLGGGTTDDQALSGDSVAEPLSEPGTPEIVEQGAQSSSELVAPDGAAKGLFDRQGGAAASGNAVAPPLPGAERTAPGKSKRQQDRSAFLALKTTTNEVREVSDEAIQITESVGGVVLSSNLSEQGKRAQANLELSIPTRELDATLDRLTDLATVKSLNEASVDITRPFVSAQDQLKDARAEREKLLEALGNASTDAEVEAIRGQLKDARRKISKAEATFDNIARRARTSKVSMTIEGSPEKSDGSWSLGEAADDALGALEVVAGVLLIGAAILAPVALLVAAITAIALAVRRRRRERALDAD